ncbi:MAG: hypothetical protein ABJE95_13230 [Byssovorax sp.]
MSRSLLISIGALGALGVTIFGCGGVGAGDGLFDSGGAGAGGTPMSTSVTTGSAPETTSTTSTTGATSSTTGTSVSSSATATSASASSSTGGVVQTLGCGNVTCPLGGENACCWSKFGMPMASGTCVDAPAASDGCKTFVAQDGLQSRIECQTSAQCAQGSTCCGHRTPFNGQNFFYDLVTCVDACPMSDVTFCDPNNPADVCPMVNTQNGPVQGVCKSSISLPPGYFVCGSPGG